MIFGEFCEVLQLIVWSRGPGKCIVGNLHTFYYNCLMTWLSWKYLSKIVIVVTLICHLLLENLFFYRVVQNVNCIYPIIHNAFFRSFNILF